MKIKSIKEKKDKVIVSFDNEVIDLYPNVFASYNLYINKIIDEKTYEDIKNDNKIEEYFLFILKRLINSYYSPNKVEEILYKKGAKKNEINNVIDKLRKYDFINEHKMVEEIISFCDSKHYGYNRIIKMANDRKISKKEIETIKYNLKREEKQCILQIKLLENRYKNKNDYGRKNSMYSALIRYGFDESISLELVNKFSNSNRAHEINVLKLDYAKCLNKYSKKYKGSDLNQKITQSLLSKGYRISDINYVKEK